MPLRVKYHRYVYPLRDIPAESPVYKLLLRDVREVLLTSDDMSYFGVVVINYDREEAEQILGASTTNLANILGHKSFDEMIHRDHLVLLTGFDSIEKGELE